MGLPWHRNRIGASGYGAAVLCIALSTQALAHNRKFPPPPPDKNITISNGGLSVTFNIAWGASVVGITDKNVANGLNIVDSKDVGRELQVCQFLMLERDGRRQVILNPTQGGAKGYQAFYRHSKGLVFPETGSPVVRWSAGADSIHAVIEPLDYDTGKPTRWVYAEDVVIDSRGVAHFHYTFYNHERRAYLMTAISPTLYSDRTGTFMYPLVSPYGRAGAALRKEKDPDWPVKVVAGVSAWPKKPLKSKGWIANIDNTDDIGIFYTVPVGFTQAYRIYSGSAFDCRPLRCSDRPPLGQTYAAPSAPLTSYPGEIYSIDFSVLVSTPRQGPALISSQPAASFKIIHNAPPAGK